MKKISLYIFALLLIFAACEKGSESQSALAPEDPAGPMVTGLDSVQAAYDQGCGISVIPGYLAISWIDLSDVTFEDRFYEEVKSYLLYPKFGERILAMEHKPVTLAGFVISAQADSGVYVLSANPLASCFFCGAAGPESVVQLNLQEDQRRFQTDEWVTFKGTLELNDSDIDQLNYILDEAAEVEEED